MTKLISAYREHIFPSRNNLKQSMNSQTANAALKRIGYGGKLVAHGLRSIASTVMNEAGFNADVIESALAHSTRMKCEELIIALPTLIRELK